jgi:PII-like signaling protein
MNMTRREKLLMQQALQESLRGARALRGASGMGWTPVEGAADVLANELYGLLRKLDKYVPTE